MPTSTTAFPRTQHWTVDGYRVSILLYKSHRHQKCDGCGQRGAIHYVSVNQRRQASERPADDLTTADLYSGMGHFCDACRPVKGAFPTLVYIRHYESGPFWTTESLYPNPEWTCLCGQPARFYDRITCRDCDDPEFQEFYRHQVISMAGERTEQGFRHAHHQLVETWECDGCHLDVDSDSRGAR